MLYSYGLVPHLSKLLDKLLLYLYLFLFFFIWLCLLIFFYFEPLNRKKKNMRKKEKKTRSSRKRRQISSDESEQPGNQFTHFCARTLQFREFTQTWFSLSLPLPLSLSHTHTDVNPINTMSIINLGRISMTSTKYMERKQRWVHSSHIFNTPKRNSDYIINNINPDLKKGLLWFYFMAY